MARKQRRNGVQEMENATVMENMEATENVETTDNVEATENVETMEKSAIEKVVESMRDAMDYSLDKANAIMTVEKKDGTTIDIVKKVYPFIEPIGNKSQLTVMDEKTIESIEKIKGALVARERSNYVICKEFSNLNDKENLEKMGFKTIGELGKALYGLETSTVNHYARIGELFITDEYQVNPMLPELSVSHLLELTAYSDGDVEKVSELYQNGTLKDGMSTKKIRETIKSLKTPAIEEKEEETIVAENGTEVVSTTETTETSKQIAEPTNETVENLKVQFDKQVVVGKMINYCEVMEQLFMLLSEHDIEVVEYDKPLASLRAMIQGLL